MTKNSSHNSGPQRAFWKTKPISDMSHSEWESLCDGCGKCCLNKLENDDTGEVHYTKIACRLLDNESCKCSQYSIRHQFVPDCIVLTPKNISEHAYWLPKTCAYYLLWKGKDLFDWHPLVSGDTNTVHEANVSVKEKTIAEFEVDEDEWEDYLWDEEV